MMRAIRVHRYGGVEQLQLDELPIPEPQAGEILVKIVASSVNPIDWRIRIGSVQERLPLTLPHILGCDFSGIVVNAGSETGSFKTGDEVYGYCGAERNGTYAEYIALPASAVALRPANLSLLESAAVPLGALTAYIPLFEDAGLASGQKVLIHAAAGGVGLMAVQLAKEAGAEVYATGSTQSVDFIRSLGADVVIDYTKVRFEDLASNMDVVLDAVGGEVQIRSLDCLRPNGYLAAIVNPPDLDLLAKRGLRGKRCAARPDGDLLRKFSAMIEAEKLRPVIEHILPIDDIAKAHQLSEAGHVHGKIVLQVAAE